MHLWTQLFVFLQSKYSNLAVLTRKEYRTAGRSYKDFWKLVLQLFSVQNTVFCNLVILSALSPPSGEILNTILYIFYLEICIKSRGLLLHCITPQIQPLLTSPCVKM